MTLATVFVAFKINLGICVEHWQTALGHWSLTRSITGISRYNLCKSPFLYRGGFWPMNLCVSEKLPYEEIKEQYQDAPMKLCPIWELCIEQPCMWSQRCCMVLQEGISHSSSEITRRVSQKIVMHRAQHADCKQQGDKSRRPRTPKHNTACGISLQLFHTNHQQDELSLILSYKINLGCSLEVNVCEFWRQSPKSKRCQTNPSLWQRRSMRGWEWLPDQHRWCTGQQRVCCNQVVWFGSQHRDSGASQI